MAQSRQEFIEQYAPLAMEQQQKYGIPASITLAQACLESGNGGSRYALQGNNFFGIKGKTALGFLTGHDDRENEHFRKYASAEKSFEDHSLILTKPRYTKYTNGLPVTDYASWARAIKAGGYASDKRYASKVSDLIEKYDLNKYTIMAQNGQQQGAAQGQAQGQAQPKPSAPLTAASFYPLLGDSQHYAMPVAASNNILTVTSPFGEKRSYETHMGIDIRAKDKAIAATEDNGKVVAVDTVGKGAAGKYVAVEYNRPDGSTVRCTYMHLSQVNVAQGSTVNAGTMLGITGNTGRSTGPHLHFQVDEVRDGKKTAIDPTNYLAALELRSGINTEMQYNGRDVLAAHKAEYVNDPNLRQQYLAEANRQLSPEEWLRKLMLAEGASKEDDDDLITKIFTNLLSMLTLFKAMSAEEKMKLAEEVAFTKEVKLNLSQYKESKIYVDTTGKAHLAVDDGKRQQDYVLTSEELHSLDNLLANTADKKAQAVNLNNIVQSITFRGTAMSNFEQLEQQQQQQQQITASR